MNEGGAFELSFEGEKSVFFIPANTDLKLYQQFDFKNIPLKSFSGQEVVALYFQTYSKALQAREFLEKNGVRTFEADIRPHERFLMERFIFGSFLYDSSQNKISSLSEYKPHFRTSSIDIETGVDQSIYSIAIHSYGRGGEFKHVWMRTEDYSDLDSSSDWMTYCLGEKQLIEKFLVGFKQDDPDFIIGWNVVGFDLRFIEKRCLKYSIDFNIGRGNTLVRFSEKKGSGFFAHIDGRVILDGPNVLRSAFYQFENFKLETVAQELLGVGKDISASGNDKVKEIEDRFREDKPALAKYNLLDCELVSQIFEHTQMIEFVTARAHASGLAIDRLGISTAAFDYFFLPKLHRMGFVANNSGSLNREVSAGGGYVVSPKAGLYKDIIVMDFKSLYPSIIKTFKIDPLSRLQSEIDTVETPCEINFSKTQNILPDHIQHLFDIRTRAKATKNNSLSQAIKILMNSFYGVMGSARCRFYHADLPNAITSIGQWVIKQTISFFENRNYQVIYGDTDSVFVQINKDEVSNLEEVTQRLCFDINSYFSGLIKSEYKVESFLEMEFEKYYPQFFSPMARTAEGGAKKRYVGYKGKGEMDLVGMEYVRSDWTKLAKKFQYNLYQKLFLGEDYTSWLKEFCDEIKAGKYDDLLVYKKRITKELSEYTKNIPPHIRAAKMLDHKGPYRLKSVSYIQTLNGPIPVKLKPTDIDYQHYIEKQVQPLADAVLHVFGQSFDGLMIGSQLDMGF